MITIYGMKSCPDCAYVEEQIEGRSEYRMIEIGEHVRNMKEFMQLRDKEKIFDEAKREGFIGIPCFVLEDGRVTLVAEEAGLKSRGSDEIREGAACNLDGSGC